jgi:hypothetical protein
MYTFLTLIAIAMVLMIAHVFFGAPAVIDALFRRAERLRSRGYLSMLVIWPVIIAASGYALATVAGVFFGFATAWADVGTFFAMVFLAFIVGSLFSVLGDVGSLGRSVVTGKPRTGTPGVRVLSSLIFVSSMYGSLAICMLKINGIVTF